MNSVPKLVVGLHGLDSTAERFYDQKKNINL